MTEGPNPPQERRIQRTARYLLLAALVMLVGNIGLAVVVARDTRSLNRSVATTESIVNANVRTIGQAQRELLRLSLLLESGSQDRAALDLQRSFVTQRMQESALGYQRHTLGSDDLLRRAEFLRNRWRRDIEPLVQRIAADPADDDTALRARAVGALRGLELQVNDLVSAGENNRKVQAGEANALSRALLGSAGVLLPGLAVTTSAFLVVTGLSLAGFARADRRRERDQERLRTLNTELATLSQVASRTDNAVTITDALGRIQWVNDAFVQRTGYAPDEAVGRRPGSLLQGPETDRTTARTMSEAVRHGRGVTCEVLNYRKDGTPLWIDLEILPVRSEDGELTHFIGVSTDITQRRETEAHLIAAKDAAEDTAAAKANFLASMSHEIRTPLNAVIGMSDLLLETPLTPLQQEYVETTQRSGAMLLAVVNDILTFSALDAEKVHLEVRPVDLRTVLEGAHAIVGHDAAAKGVAMDLVVSPALPALVEIDEVRVRQIVLNLLANAVKFTPSGSVRTTVSADREPHGRHRVAIAVADTGIGIPAGRIDQLFEPFSQVDSSTTRRFGGTGLGLAITQRLVRLMGGTITIDSELGSGTTVTVTLPLTGYDLATPAFFDAGPTADVPSLDGGLRVLVAEDDEINRLVAERLLRRLGVAADLVCDGMAAVEAVQAQRYDVVLMDINMPGLDGVAATRAIHEAVGPAGRPWIVAMTANALAGDRERFLAAGLDDYLSKPVRLGDLRDLLGTVPRRQPVA